jgi:hypothetical protein
MAHTENCKVDGCPNTWVIAFSLCQKHYQTMRRNGKPDQYKYCTVEGITKHPLYSVHRSMIQRCYDPNCKSYADYGLRGIKVCQRWLGPQGFLNFVSDMGGKPSPKHSIDRIDNDGIYEPTNCRWATRLVQNINKGMPKYNKSGTKGVYLDQSGKNWIADYSTGSKKIRKFFKFKEDAIAERLRGEEIYYKPLLEVR